MTNDIEVVLDLDSLRRNAERTRDGLLDLRRRFDLSRFEYTRRVRIAPLEIPHSHPTLTLNGFALSQFSTKFLTPFFAAAFLRRGLSSLPEYLPPVSRRWEGRSRSSRARRGMRRTRRDCQALRAASDLRGGRTAVGRETSCSRRRAAQGPSKRGGPRFSQSPLRCGLLGVASRKIVACGAQAYDCFRGYTPWCVCPAWQRIELQAQFNAMRSARPLGREGR
jgi:hypothetical protein